MRLASESGYGIEIDTLPLSNLFTRAAEARFEICVERIYGVADPFQEPGNLAVPQRREAAPNLLQEQIDARTLDVHLGPVGRTSLVNVRHILA